MTRPLHLLSVVLVALVATATAAEARPIRVVLTQLDDDRAGVGKAVAAALEDSELEIVPSKQVSRAVTRLGPGAALDADNLAKIAAALDADAVVQCEFDRRTRRLRVAIFADGKLARRFNVTARDPESEKFRKAVRSAMLTRITAVVPAGTAAERAAAPRKGRRADPIADEASEPASRSKGKARRASEARDDTEHASKRRTQAADPPPADDADTARPAAAEPERDDPADDDTRRASARVAARDDQEQADDQESAEREPAGALGAERMPGTASAPRAANLPAIRLDAGASAVGRRLEFKSTTGFTGAPPNYSNAPVPGARVAGEIYPFALDAPSGWLAGLGAAAEYDQALSINLRATGDMTVPLAITERSYSLGLRYRLAFGHRPTSPTLTLGIGYAARTFTVDRTRLTNASIDLPDVDYRMFDPGLSLRLPIGERVALTLGGRGLLVMSAGAIQNADQYGMARVYGASATAGVEFGITPWIGLRIAAEATQIGSTFSGTGTLSSSRDGDSSTVDVRGAIDRYYGGTASLAVMY